MKYLFTLLTKTTLKIKSLFFKKKPLNSNQFDFSDDAHDWDQYNDNVTF